MTNNATILRFDQASEQYQTSSIKYRKISADKVSQLIEPSLTDVILDIGCGTGTQLIQLAGMIKRGIGIDISSGMVKKAKEQLEKASCTNLEFYTGDFLNLEAEISLSPIKINKIISNYALHHLDLADKKKALQKIIHIADDHLQMIVIGDLMFFDDPKKYAEQYDLIGYGPGTDLPCYAEELVNLFDANTFTITLDRLHPLVGVLKAVKKI